MNNGSICDVLATLPPNYPVDNVIVFGLVQATTNFLSIANGLAVFRNDGEIKIFDCSRIDGLDMN